MLWVPPNIFVISLLDVTIDLYTDSTGSSGGVVYSTASSRQSVVYYTTILLSLSICVRSFIKVVGWKTMRPKKDRSVGRTWRLPFACSDLVEFLGYHLSHEEAIRD